MNPFKRMKLKSKLRNCDYKLAGTVIKQQYYNDNSHTEINRMIDHFMEDPGFERALDLIEYNEMIVFYFTESCTDGLYVRKTSNSTEQLKSSEQAEDIQFEQEQAPIFTEPTSASRLIDDTVSATASPDLNKKPSSSHSEHLQKIQESEEWMDQMISRLTRKPKQPAVPDTPPHTSIPPKTIFNIATPAAKIYDDEEAEAFDTIEFQSPDAFRDIEVFDNDDVKSVPEVQPNRKIVVFEEPEVFEEPVKETVVFEEPEIFAEPAKETVVFIEPFVEPVVFEEPVIVNEDIRAVQDDKPNDAFEFVASAQSSKHLEAIDPSQLFGTPLTPAPVPEPAREKRPRFPNVAATLKIDLHTMMKQLDEYRHELAYHPSNEQQMIRWIESLEKAIDEFSTAIDMIEDAFE